MPDTRPTFHHQLDEVQRDLMRAAARVTESHHAGHRGAARRSTSPRPRRSSTATRRSTSSPSTSRSAASRSWRAAADGQRHAGGRHRHPARPRRSSGRATSWSTSAKATRRLYGSAVPPALQGLAAGDGRRERPPLPPGDGRLRRRRRRPGGRPRRHGRPARRAPPRLHPGDPGALRRRARRPGGGAARPRRPLLRAHRRPRREHRRARASTWSPAGCPSTRARRASLDDARRSSSRRSRSCWRTTLTLVFVGQKRLARRLLHAGRRLSETSCRSAPGWPRRRRSSSGRSTAPCSGAARAPWPRRASPARWPCIPQGVVVFDDDGTIAYRNEVGGELPHGPPR